MNQTLLHSLQAAAGARMVEFAGWTMPVQFAGILDEHAAVRGACGVFDISHMGEFFVRGPGAAAWLDHVLTNRASALQPGQSQYSLLLNDQGGIIDDLIVYCIRDREYLLVVNAACIDADRKWLLAHPAEEVTFEDVSALYSALAVQGPDSPGVFKACFGRELPAERNRVVGFERGGEDFWVATTGYTGETGFEVICRNAEIRGLWEAVTASGAVPCGLGARDLLRLEMGYPLNGSDLGPDHTPLEAGLGFAVDFDKPDFIGRDALLAQRARGLPVRLAALVAEGKTPPFRAHYPVWKDGLVLGETTSGGLSPALGASIAMAYLPPDLAKPGTSLEIDIRGRMYPATTTTKPFIKKA
jgi:aminomethyltransferase